MKFYGQMETERQHHIKVWCVIIRVDKPGIHWHPFRKSKELKGVSLLWIPVKYSATIQTVLQEESWVVETSVFTAVSNGVTSAVSAGRHSQRAKAQCSTVFDILWYL